jgi:DNA polymerase-3 subunit delta
MAKPVSATDFLSKPTAPAPVCVVAGDDSFLRRQVIQTIRGVFSGAGEDDAEFSLTTFEGGTVELRDVLDELATVAMFGPGQRLVVVEQADDFVKRCRPELEDYVENPRRTGVLVLELNSFPANTRLYKAVAQKGQIIGAGAPKGGQLVRWVTGWTRRKYKADISPAAAELLVDLVGPELGLLNQELAKLSLSTGADKRITPELVKQLVGTWRSKTAWEMLDAALDGNVAEAVRQLDRLLGAGEQPIGVLAQVSASLRRFAAATRLILQSEAAGRRMPLRRALEQAGVRSFVLHKAERQLRRLGRQRGRQLYRWLLEADLDLKGASNAPPRIILERLIVRLAAPAEAVLGSS